jgi:hypothetical protein
MDIPRFTIHCLFPLCIVGVVSMAFIWDGGPFLQIVSLTFIKAIWSWLMQNRQARHACLLDARMVARVHMPIIERPVSRTPKNF